MGALALNEAGSEMLKCAPNREAACHRRRSLSRMLGGPDHCCPWDTEQRGKAARVLVDAV